jgi:hypothetical protein
METAGRIVADTRHDGNARLCPLDPPGGDFSGTNYPAFPVRNCRVPGGNLLISLGMKKILRKISSLETEKMLARRLLR